MKTRLLTLIFTGITFSSFTIVHASAPTVTVSLSGDIEQLTDSTYTYSASGSYTLDAETQDEEADGQASVSDRYIWSYPGTLESGGGESDTSVTISFGPDDTPGGVISVTYEVTVTYADGTSDSSSDTDSITAVWPIWEPGATIACPDGITAPSEGERVAAESEVTCSIGAATDNDTRIGEIVEVDRADSFGESDAYSWSAGAGSFKDGDNTGSSVTWIAPSESGEVTVTGTAADDAVIPSGEGGIRDDSDYTDSVTITVVSVDHLECEGVTSDTDNPGDAETVFLPLNFNDGSVTVTAHPDPSGNWPGGKPSWSGDVLSSSGGTAQIDTTATGTKTVTAECGNSVSIKVVVIEIASIEARRKSSGESYAGSTTIAAGGYSSDVHKADIRLTINPVPTGSFSVDFAAQLSGAGAHTGTACTATFSAGGSLVLEGNGEGTLTVTDANSTGGVVTGLLTSSNVINMCTVTVGAATTTVHFRWDNSGTYDYDGPSFFVPGIGDAIKFFPTLDEVAVEDEDGDGTVGEGAIGGHSMDYWTKKFTVRYWKYDYNTGSYIEPVTYETFDDLDGDNIEVHFGQNLHDLIDHSATAETATGVYENTQTVYDYYDYTDGVEEVIEVWSYAFGIYDTELFLSE